MRVRSLLSLEFGWGWGLQQKYTPLFLALTSLYLVASSSSHLLWKRHSQVSGLQLPAPRETFVFPGQSGVS